MKYTFIKSPTVHLIAETTTVANSNLGKSLKRRGADLKGTESTIQSLFPDAADFPMQCEELCMVAGKLCYNAFGKNGSKKTTKQYLEDSVYKNKHLSIAYHSHFSFYISGISRRIGEEFKRHHVGTAYSQMSSRYCVHLPRFVVPPKYLSIESTEVPYNGTQEELDSWFDSRINEYKQYKKAMKSAYRHYLKQVSAAEGKKGIEKKRILEAAAGTLPMSIETSMVVTMNPISARKLILERTGETADLEFMRLAEKMRTILEERYTAFNFR